MRKLCSKWVPRELTIDPKQQRIDDSKQCLELFNHNKSEFLRRYVTMDETWLHHFTLESNRQSAEWTARDEPTPKCGKTQKSVGKVMASVFWDTHDGKAASFEEKESAVSSRQCTVSQINEIDDKIVGIGLRIASESTVQSRFDPSDFFLFSDLKRMLAGQKFCADEEVIAETEAYFKAEDKSYYKNGIEKLCSRYRRCITLEGNYIK
ncbi:putative DD34D transposase [Trichonephila clavipes]|nr:putative DD34D transposase [Trichonephila clavipes]